jgi:uncharacterized protein (DUF1697 family)
MTVYVALLRAINVGGTGNLLMAELRALCAACGLHDAATFIQSGNVVFRSALPAAKVKAQLEKAVTAKVGKPVTALVRTAGELAAIAKRSPFPGADPSRVLVTFLDDAPEAALVADLKTPGKEKVVLFGRELFVYYPAGVGRSKLKLAFAKSGTARNLATVAKLAELAAGLARS